ncbi:hypothetical protein E2320_002474 [Naja naja]|nr:hypothetical protein E2320_002474 [Naja naja]
MGSPENLLKELYKSSNVLQVAPKAKITKNEEIRKLEVQKHLTIEIAKISENKEKTHELEIQKEVATEISEHSGEFTMRSKSPLKWLKKHPKTIQEDHELGKKQTGEELFCSFLKKRRQFVKSIQKLQGEQKCSILHLPTQLPALTSSIVVDDDGVEQPDKVVFILKSGNRSARPSHVESETFNKLLPDKALSNKVHWEYQEQTTSAPLISDFWSSIDNYFLQGHVFEAEVQKQLAHLILNEPMRNLIAHLICMIKVDCRELTIQKPCDFFHR